MPNLRQIRRRISAVSNIQQVTKAMQMIAASRVRKAQDRILQTRPYAERLETLMHHMASMVAQSGHTLVEEREIRHATVIVVTGDRGLCRAFNTNAIRAGLDAHEELTEAGAEVEFIAVGRKSAEYFRRRRGTYKLAAEHPGLFSHLEFLHAQQIAVQVVDRYREGDTDRVVVAYNKFKNMLQQELITKQFLPLRQVKPSVDNLVDYIYEPGKEAIWEQLIAQYVDLEVWRILLESNAAEQAARMTAMEEATNNAQDMIKDLTSVRNKVRQGNITRELSEIVGGSSALE